MSPGQVLEGGQVQLRSPQYKELEYIRNLWADPATMTEVGGPVILSDQQAEEWFARMVSPGSAQNSYYLITVAGVPVGEISFHHLDQTTMTARLNVKVEGKHRRRGYGRDALEALCRFFFVDLGGEELTDDIALDNLKGQKALLEFGFEHDPSVEDVYLVRMTKERFLTLYGSGE